jgi:hypothetical protein
MGVVTISPINILFNNIFNSYEFIVFLIFITLYTFQFINIGPLINFINNNDKVIEDFIISIITGIMFPFGLVAMMEILHYNSYLDTFIIYILTLYYSYNTNTIDLLLLLSLFSVIGLFIIYIIGCTYSFYRKCNNEKQVIIVRGVPGSGKVSYIVSQEYNDCDVDNFKLCYWQNFYGKGLSYKYRPNETKQAELWSLMRFINASIRRIPRIYIVSTFERKWQYDIYVCLAQIMRYKVKIIELECRDLRDLRYFQLRSTHNIPFSRAERIFNDWEYDERAILQDPYIDPNLKGDSIPLNDNSITEKTLDKELYDYFNGNNKIKNNTERKIDNRQRSLYNISYVSDDDKYLLGL